MACEEGEHNRRLIVGIEVGPVITEETNPEFISFLVKLGTGQRCQHMITVLDAVAAVNIVGK